MAAELILSGCSPTPLASYLKALAILRLLGEQKPEWHVTGCWQEEQFVLKSAAFGESEQNKCMVENFFLNEYRPTPILTPWNGRGGFLEGEDDEGEDDEGEDDEGETGRAGLQMVALFSDKDISARFHDFTITLKFISEIEGLKQLNSERSRWKELRKLADAKKAEKKKVEDVEKEALKQAEKAVKTLKSVLLRDLRNLVPPELLEWFDACQILSDKPLHAPLLGRGGLDGSMDFGVNFMQRLSDLFVLKTGQPSERGHRLLTCALYDAPVPALFDSSIGQFDPGAAGGLNAGTGFEGASLVNPWDLVLSLEGALLFIASATKRQGEVVAAELSYPFTTLPVGRGSGGVDIADENPSGAKRRPYEIWLPLWNHFASIQEIKALFSEGRVTIGRKPVRNALDFVRGVTTLGVDRGVGAFQRYGFLMRAGKAFLATPLSRIDVSRNPTVDLMTDLDRNQWLDRFRRLGRDKNCSRHIASLAGRLDDALFKMALRSKEAKAVQDALIVLGEVQTALAKSSKAKDEKTGIPPVPLLNPQWRASASDGSEEFQIASALADLGGEKEKPMPLSCHLWPIHPQDRQWIDTIRKHKPSDPSCSHRFHVPRGRNLYAWLSDILERRLLLADRLDFEEKPVRAVGGCDLEALALLVSHQVDDRRIAELLPGLALVAKDANDASTKGYNQSDVIIPSAFAAMKLVFLADDRLRRYNVLPEKGSCPIPSGLVRLLRANRKAEALGLAMRRLRSSGIFIAMPNAELPDIPGEQIAAALLLPLTPSAAGKLISRFVAEHEYTQKTTLPGGLS